jgi:hypothetical protein
MDNASAAGMVGGTSRHDNEGEDVNLSRFRRDRRTWAVVPAVAAAAFLSLGAIAFACVGPGAGQTVVAESTAEPGGVINVSGTGVQPSTTFRLNLNASSMNCHHGGSVLGGNVLSTSGGVINSVQRTVPATATSGVRYLCWVNPDNADINANPDSVTIV